MDSDLLTHLLNLGRHVVIRLLKLVDGMIRAIANGPLVSLVGWYQNFEAELGTSPLTCGGVGRRSWQCSETVGSSCRQKDCSRQRKKGPYKKGKVKANDRVVNNG